MPTTMAPSVESCCNLCLFQPGVNPEPQRCVLPDAGAVVRSRQSGVVLGPAAVDGRYEQDADQNPRRP